MAKKDRFQQMRQQGGGALSSFQDLATTVAAIEKQAEPTAQYVQEKTTSIGRTVSPDTAGSNTGKNDVPVNDQPSVEAQRYMRLSNPQIPVGEYNLVSAYCNSFSNMTRQDFVELAIIEKLHHDGQMTDEEFRARRDEGGTAGGQTNEE